MRTELIEKKLLAEALRRNTNAVRWATENGSTKYLRGGKHGNFVEVRKAFGMRWQPRNKLFVRANCYFSPETCRALSYGWWIFVDRIKGKIVFNNYRYSPSTAKHQYEVRRLLEKLRLKIDLEIPVRGGLQAFETSGTHILLGQIQTLNELIAKKGTRRVKNIERRAEVKRLEALVNKAKGLGAK